MNRLLAAIALSLALISQGACADEEIDSIRSQIKALEARLDALEHKKEASQASAAPVAAPAAAAPASLAAAAPSAGKAPLESRVTALEAKDAQEPTAKYIPGKGLTITSPDKNFSAHVGGYFQADDRSFLGHTNATNSDQFLIRSARPIFEAKFYDMFAGRLMMDFGNNQTTLIDAYGDITPAEAFNLRFGKFKDPIGLERWQSEQNVLFVERGMTTNLVPYRDIGVQAYGSLIPGTLEYQVAATNGTPDLLNSTGSPDNDKTVTARIMAHPFYETGIGALKGLGVGFATSLGARDGSLANPGVTAGYVTPAQSKFFTYAGTSFASGTQQRFNPQIMYYNGPFSILSEYVRENQDLTNGGNSANLHNQAWMATTTYVLTGEDARFEGVVPSENFDLRAGHWGAFELVARMSTLYVDDATFPAFASMATSAKIARESTIGGTWYMNPAVKFNLDFALTRFDGGTPGGDRPTERAVLSRAQFSF